MPTSLYGRETNSGHVPRGMVVCAAIAVIALLGARSSLAVNFDIQAPTENSYVNPGQIVTVIVYAYGSVTGIKSIRSQGEGDIAETANYPMFPPVISVTEYFSYYVPTNVTNGQSLTITVRLEDYVDGIITKTRHVIVSGGATPTPTPTSTPPPSNYDYLTYSGTVDCVVVDNTRNYLYLVNTTNARVDVADIPSRTIVGNIPVGTGPVGADITSNSATLYVCNSVASTISVVDLETQTVTRSINFDPPSPDSAKVPTWIAIGLGNAWVASADAGQHGAIFDLNLANDALTKVTSFSFGSIYNPTVEASADDRYVIASARGATPCTFVLQDTQTDALVDDQSIYSDFYQSMAINHDGSYSLFNGTTDNTRIFDQTLTQVTSVPIERACVFIPTSWEKAAGFVYSYPNDYDHLVIYDIDNGVVADTLPGISGAGLGDQYDTVADPDGDMLYVFGEGRVYFVPINYALSARTSVWSLYE